MIIWNQFFSVLLKGLCHQLNIFWKTYKIKSVLSVVGTGIVCDKKFVFGGWGGGDISKGGGKYGYRLSDPYPAFFLPIATTSNKNF